MATVVPTIQELNAIIGRWTDAELQGDATFLTQFLADDFLAVGPRGFVLPKDTWLRRHAPGGVQYATFRVADAQWRSYGAMSIAVCRISHTGFHHEHFAKGELRATLAFVVHPTAGWQMVSLHMSPAVLDRRGQKTVGKGESESMNS